MWKNWVCTYTFLYIIQEFLFSVGAEGAVYVTFDTPEQAQQ